MEIVIILGLIFFNGILSMSEIAMVSARKSRLETAAKKGSKTAKTALRLANEPDRFLSTIQIGITLIGILTGLYSGEALAGDLARWLETIGIPQAHSLTLAKGIIVILVTYLTLILGELVPKHLGMNAPEKIARLIARPMEVLSKIASPFVWLLSASTQAVIRLTGLHTSTENKVTEEEIKAIIQEGTEDGEIQEVEQDIVEKVFNLGDRKIGSIMTHRSDLIWLEIGESAESIRNKVKENVYTVYPVAHDELDHIEGVVYLKDLFSHLDEPDFKLADILRPAQFFPENQSVYNTLGHLKSDHIKYGLVTDEFGSIQGIVTLKDIVDVLLGEITESHDEPEIIRRDDGSLLVDGQCSFYEFLEYIDMECLYPEYDYNTISGLILHLLEHIPIPARKSPGTSWNSRLSTWTEPVSIKYWCIARNTINNKILYELLFRLGSVPKNAIEPEIIFPNTFITLSGSEPISPAILRANPDAAYSHRPISHFSDQDEFR